MSIITHNILLAAFTVGAIALGMSWIIRLVIYLIHRYKGAISFASDKRCFKRWLAGSIALMIVALFTFTPAFFLIRF